MKQKEQVRKYVTPYGAIARIRITGQAEEVAREVNRLSNAGIVSNVAEDYKENVDESVTVTSSKEKLERGLKFLASMETRKVMGRKKLRAFSTYRKLSKEAAAQFAAEFTEEKAERGERHGTGVFAQVHIPAGFDR